MNSRTVTRLSRWGDFCRRCGLRAAFGAEDEPYIAALVVFCRGLMTVRPPESGRADATRGRIIDLWPVFSRRPSRYSRRSWKNAFRFSVNYIFSDLFFNFAAFTPTSSMSPLRLSSLSRVFPYSFPVIPFYYLVSSFHSLTFFSCLPSHRGRREIILTNCIRVEFIFLHIKCNKTCKQWRCHRGILWDLRLTLASCRLPQSCHAYYYISCNCRLQPCTRISPRLRNALGNTMRMFNNRSFQ